MNKKVKDCIDMGEWKHSWHNKFKELEDFEKCRDVIKDNIAERITQLQELSEGLAEIDCIISREREYLSEASDD